MCGRFNLHASPQQLIEVFELLRDPPPSPRLFNIAPTLPIVVVRQSDEGRIAELMKWGLIPSWAKDPSIAASLINARSETASTKPAFRAAFKRRRCLLPTTGFYEWDRSNPKDKRPFLFQRADLQPFGMAGLWECWQSPDGSEVQTCSVLTTEANSVVRAIHDRMPVILPPEHVAAWLEPSCEDIDFLQTLMQPLAADLMTSEEVSSTINNARGDLDPRGLVKKRRTLFD